MSERKARYTTDNARRDNIARKQLPDEFLQVLEATQSRYSTASWELADILNDMQEEWGQPLPRGQVADALGVLPSQVSALIMTAQRIEPATRVLYAELAFSCFMFAARDDDPNEVLRLAVESADEYGGRPGGVRVVRAIIKERAGGGNAKDKPRAWSGHIVTINDACYALLCTGDERPIDGSAGTWRETQ
jgi:hypothetical protein